MKMARKLRVRSPPLSQNMPNFNRYATRTTKQTYNGRSYHSRAEAEYAIYLDQRLNAGEIKSWTPQKRIELLGENGSHICNYYIDFVVEHHDGVTELIEVKGFETNIWNLKWKMLKDKYGHDAKYKITLEKV